MENLRNRLREELSRLGLSAAEAARQLGEPSSLGIRDVLNGRKRLSAELLASLAIKAGVDALYVLTEERSNVTVTSISTADQALLKDFHAAPRQVQEGVKTTLGAFASSACPASKYKRTA